jgi:hypothetical protein
VDGRFTPGDRPRTHRQALAELCRRLVDLKVRAADWPDIAEITGQYPEDLLALHGGS